jgi:hypothetical protein
MQKKYIVRLTQEERLHLLYEFTNNKQRGVDWQMKVDDAQIKLKPAYPKIKL